MTNFNNFLTMGNYGVYVWTAYGSALVCLFLQWYIPWRRWRKYLKTRIKNNKDE